MLYRKKLQPDLQLVTTKQRYPQIKNMSEELEEFKYQTPEEIAALQKFPEPDEDETDGPASSPGYVYFVTESGTNNFKVGRTVDPRRRHSELQREAQSRELRMRPVCVSNMLEAEQSLLRAMREKFRGTSRGTEWFTGDVAEAQRIFTRIANRYRT
jgi:hypothetical protein